MTFGLFNGKHEENIKYIVWCYENGDVHFCVVDCNTYFIDYFLQFISTVTIVEIYCIIVEGILVGLLRKRFSIISVFFRKPVKVAV